LSKKFRFPLEKLLGYRTRLESVAQTELQSALAEVEAARDVLSGFEAGAHRAQQGRGQATESPLKQNQIDDFLRLRTIQKDRQVKKIQRLEDLAEKKRDVLRARATERRAVDKLRDKSLEEHRIEQDQNDRREADDNTTMRFNSEVEK
jgi:flagellar export protein FliJ